MKNTRDFKRNDRIAELIQPELAQLIQHRLRDPRLPGFISITAIKVSPDLRHARVYFTAVNRASHTELTTEERNAAVHHLNAAAGFLRLNLAKSLKMLRVAPTLFFVYDDSIQHSRHLRQLIDTANQVGLDAEEEQENETDSEPLKSDVTESNDLMSSINPDPTQSDLSKAQGLDTEYAATNGTEKDLSEKLTINTDSKKTSGKK